MMNTMMRHTILSGGRRASQRMLLVQTAAHRCMTPSIRAFATSSSSEWTNDFLKATEHIHHDVPFEESANMLRDLCKTDLVKASDLMNHPERFFEAHRILARHAANHGPGFWVRFTVHYNLFAGTILAVGNEEQVAELATYQAKGQLGCFALTEKLAGVQSGLVVQTTAEWDDTKQKFILNTPTKGARKNWISQGFTADKAVVIADLTVGDEKVGPHAFVMDFRKEGELVPGISVDDMGRKTAGNDLDNAWIDFDHVELDKSALLSKYADINDDGQYELKYEGLRPFDMIGQRLYTGRICVAQAGLEYRRQLFQQTKDYSDSKAIFSFKGQRALSDIPQLSAIYQENEEKMKKMDAFVKSVELSLADCIRRQVPPNTDLVEAIATCKVKAVEDSIEMCFRLKQEVGSFALMGESGFGNMDFLQACKFAEGDSRILMQKMSRDRLKQFVSAAGGSGDDTTIPDFTPQEMKLCRQLAGGMEVSLKGGMDKQEAWDKEWKTVYALAEAVMDRVMETGVVPTEHDKAA